MEKISPVKERRTIKIEDWMAEGEKRFGKDIKQWKFICPSCKTVQTAQDLLDAGVKKDDIDGYLGFSCIGRFAKDKGCNWTLGGLFQIHTFEIELENGHKRAVFEFAEEMKDGENKSNECN